MRENKNIDELFREKLQNYEQEPPAYLLENILAGAAVNSKRKKLVFWRISAVAAALLLAFIAGWQFNANNNADLTQPTVAIQNTDNQNVNENLPRVENQTPQIASVKLIQDNSALNPSISGRSKYEKSNSIVETSLLTSTNESHQLKLIQGRSNLIPNNMESALKLQKQKQTERDVKSIDQQIMEQNQQLLMAQNSVKEKRHWLLGAQVSPIHNGSKSNQSAQYASNMLTSESSNTVNLGGGLTVEYKPGKRWSIQSGVYYGGMEQTSGNSRYPTESKNSISADFGSEYLTTKVNVDAKTNRISMNSPTGVIQINTVPTNIVIGNSIESNDMASAVFISEAQFTQNFEYVEIPLYLRYTLLDTKFDIEILGGFSSNVLVGNQAFVETNSGKTLVGKTEDMELINYSGTLGMGFKYGLSKRFFLNLEPRVKYYLNSLNSNESVSYKPYTIGIFTGLSYQF
jgi:hypothetical protein